MPSPFAVFRKYQAALLAVFGVLIMIVFVVGDSINKIAGRGGGSSEDPVAVTWSDRKLTESELFRLMQLRARVQKFMQRAQVMAIAQGAFGEQGHLMLQFGMLPVQPIIHEQGVSMEATVRSMILAKKAENQGFVVSDEEIDRYLNSLVDQTFDELDWNKLMPRFGISVNNIRKVLRKEMLANRLLEQFFGGIRAPTMAQKLDYYSRLKLMARAEILAIPVDELLAEVREPADPVLEAYFDKYKFLLPQYTFIGGVQYDSPTPGFKLPHRVSVQYAKANTDEYVQLVRDTVTDEEIQNYYEQNKSLDQWLHAVDSLELPETDAAGDTTSESNKKDAESNTEAQESSNQKTTADDVEGKEEADSKKKEVDDARGQKTEDAVGKEADGQSSQNTKTAEGSEKANKDDNKKSDAKQATAPSESEQKTPKFKPLDEVRDYIHQEVAKQKANELIDEKFARLRSAMDQYYQARLYADENQTIKAPDFKALAKQYDLPAFENKLLSARRYLDSTDIGKSARIGKTGESSSFIAVAFQQGEQSLYSPVITSGEGDRFLFWKTDEREEEVPLLDTVRDKVVRQWKLGAGLEDDTDHARGIARQKAKSLVSKLGDGKSMADLEDRPSGSELIDTEFFSWLTMGSAPGYSTWQQPPVRISPIEEIDQPGPEFMQTVFGLAEGEAGVAMNFPKNYVYVVRLKSQNKSADVLQQNFLDEFEDRVVSQTIQAAAQLDLNSLRRAWFNEMDDEVDLVWVKPELRFVR